MSFKSQKSSKEEFSKRTRDEISQSERRKVANNLIGQKEEPFGRLYEDITKEKLMLLLEKILKVSDYHALKDHSNNCLDISLECRKIIPRKVKDWLSNILKASDVLLLHLIQCILDEEIVVLEGRVKERNAYNHLEKNESLKSVGSAFNAIYDKRNDLEHKQEFRSNTGEIVLKNMGNKKKIRTLEYCIKELEQCLPFIIDKFRENHKEYCIN